MWSAGDLIYDSCEGAVTHRFRTSGRVHHIGEGMAGFEAAGLTAWGLQNHQSLGYRLQSPLFDPHHIEGIGPSPPTSLPSQRTLAPHPPPDLLSCHHLESARYEMSLHTLPRWLLGFRFPGLQSCRKETFELYINTQSRVFCSSGTNRQR